MDKIDWQPIETAPKDRTKILVCYKGSMWVDSFSYGVLVTSPYITPTYWMQLPEPPK